MRPNSLALADPLRFWAATDPARIALVDRGRGERFTYAEMDRRAGAWAGVLRGIGVGPGALVALLAGNRVETVDLFHACARIGAALLPLNWRLAPAELAEILADARPAVLFGEARFRAAAESAASECPWVDLDHEAPRLFVRADRADAREPRDPEAALLVLYTSGSTGRPKGAVLPHRQLLWNAVATTLAWELSSADVAPVSTPFFHTGGWNVFATPLWQLGGRVVLFEGFEPEAFLETLAEEECTLALTVPTQLLMLVESPGWGRPLPRLRRFMSGGAPCPPALASRARAAGYRIREGYGLTECGPNCFVISDEEALRKPGCVGRPVPFLEMKLVDAEGAGAAEGELLLRGPQLFGGYLRDSARTEEVFAPDGWLRTGDVARRDEDGAYFISGRRKEMYISGGENVFPGEVEGALGECPGVAEVVVVGIPDERWGEVGRAFVVARPGAGLTSEAVLAHARGRLAGFKIPRSVRIVDRIPRLGSGKPDRRSLTESNQEAS